MKETETIYDSPRVRVVEIKERKLLCTSQQEASNAGYESTDYQW